MKTNNNIPWHNFKILTILLEITLKKIFETLDRIEKWRRRFNQMNWQGWKTPKGKAYSQLGNTIVQNSVLLRKGMKIEDTVS